MAVYQEERARSRADVVVRDPDLIEVDGRHGGKTSLNRQLLATAAQAALMGSDPLLPKQTGASGHCRMRPSLFNWAERHSRADGFFCSSGCLRGRFGSGFCLSTGSGGRPL